MTQIMAIYSFIIANSPLFLSIATSVIALDRILQAIPSIQQNTTESAILAGINKVGSYVITLLSPKPPQA